VHAVVTDSPTPQSVRFRATVEDIRMSASSNSLVDDITGTTRAASWVVTQSLPKTRNVTHTCSSREPNINNNNNIEMVSQTGLRVAGMQTACDSDTNTRNDAFLLPWLTSQTLGTESTLWG
jgi:hypothetical protein